MGIYIALLRKEKDSDFGVDFPDFPGCITAGKTLEEAHKGASEALRFHIKGMLEAYVPRYWASGMGIFRNGVT
jgi:predicted RNase H-like HicB family nuclease